MHVERQMGVAGFFGKDQELDKIATALDTIAAGRVTPPPESPDEDPLSALTPRETEVLRLHMSVKTVNTHLHNLRGKLGVHSSLEAVSLARSRPGQERVQWPGRRPDSPI